ncbi:MAG: outer membrane beta-barrel protein [Sediminibacterium sp.]|nr:outer membrane beta-barrel protein [Sediminibacterium sp.]
MKKTVLFILTLLSALYSLKGQERVFSLKPGAGITACQIHGDRYNGFNKFGVNLGLSVSAALTTKASLDLGFYFIQKGARHNQNPEKNDFTFYRVNLNYLECPLLLNYNLNKDYFVTLGGSGAYLINYREDNETGNLTGLYPFKNIEYALSFGLGRHIGKKLSVEVRSSNSVVAIRPYGIQATNVFFPNPVARYFNKGLYNNILLINIHYHLTFTKTIKTDET